MVLLLKSMDPTDLSVQRATQEIAAPVSPRVRAARDYFHQLSTSGRLPRRTDLRPSAMADVLDLMFVLEHTEDDRFICRLFSAGSVAVFGYDFTGEEITPESAYGSWLPRYRTVLAERRPRYYNNIFVYGEGERILVEAGLFPLANAAGEPAYVLYVYGETED